MNNGVPNVEDKLDMNEVQCVEVSFSYRYDCTV